jgi:hypothetical protein
MFVNLERVNCYSSYCVYITYSLGLTYTDFENFPLNIVSFKGVSLNKWYCWCSKVYYKWDVQGCEVYSVILQSDLTNLSLPLSLFGCLIISLKCTVRWWFILTFPLFGKSSSNEEYEDDYSSSDCITISVVSCIFISITDGICYNHIWYIMYILTVRLEDKFTFRR